MVVITCIIAADNGPAQYLEEVSATWWDLQKEDRDTDVILVSGEHQARVHRAILLRISPFLHGLVPSSCPCSTPAITLPKVRGDTLEALVELAYTGRSQVESTEAKEEFAELTKLVEIGIEVQYEEIISQEREDPATRANQVAEGKTAATAIVKRADEKAAADKRKKDEEKAAADKRKKDEEKAAEDKRNKDEEKAAVDKRKEDEEKAAADIRKKDEENAAEDKRKKDEEKAAEDERKKDEEKAAEDKRKKDEEKAAADKIKKDEEQAAADKRRKDEEKTAATMSKIEQKDKATSLKDKEAGVEKVDTEFIAALGLNKKVENKTAAENEKRVKKTDATKKVKRKVLEEMPREAVNVMEKTEVKLTPDSVEISKVVDEASSVKVDLSRQTRGRRRKSKVQETQTIPFLSQISQSRRTTSPDSILAKTTRNQKRKIQTILDVNDDIDATPEPKRKRIDLCIDKTEEPSRFVKIQDITANNGTDANLFDEDDVNQNNNDLVQDPVKVNAANDSAEELFENSQMSILSDEGFRLDGSKDRWDKETESNDKEAKFVCPFCKKAFQQKSRYDYHLSLNHFREEISDKFPGLECPVCKKRFVKESTYVPHLGSFHKIIDGLMAVAFDDKMALIREAEQRKSFASPKHEGGDNVWMETPKRKNASTPNKKRQKNSLCKKEAEESSEMANAATEESSEMANAAIEESSEMANASTPDQEESCEMANAATPARTINEYVQ